MIKCRAEFSTFVIFFLVISVIGKQIYRFLSTIYDHSHPFVLDMPVQVNWICVYVRNITKSFFNIVELLK